jgi:hypothetical protein
MFGGMGASGAVFRETWTFDGTHWTHRQDVGPAARFSHGMSFDAVRRSIVLFGGRDATGNPLGDTWEHAEIDPPPPAINVLSVTLPSMSVSSGDPVTAGITLTAPALAGTHVELSWAPHGDTTHTLLATSVVPAGDIVLSITFTAPQVGGGGGVGARSRFSPAQSIVPSMRALPSTYTPNATQLPSGLDIVRKTLSQHGRALSQFRSY